MIIFETNRLVIKSIEERDKEYFIELLSDSKIIDPVPQSRLTEEEIMEKFNSNLNISGKPEKNRENIWGVFEKGSSEMIGLCALIANDVNEWGIGYRFRTNYWNKGYGTETTKGLIDYSFLNLKLDRITADANVENLGSLKILDKFMNLESEFFNEKDNCTDRRYAIERERWLG